MDQCIKCGGSRENIDRLTRENADLRAKLADANHRAQSQADAMVVACRGTPHRSAADLRQALDEQAEAVMLLAQEAANSREFRRRLMEYTLSFLDAKGEPSSHMERRLIAGYSVLKERVDENPTAAAAVKEAGQ